jgi:hypothetical protein
MAEMATHPQVHPMNLLVAVCIEIGLINLAVHHHVPRAKLTPPLHCRHGKGDSQLRLCYEQLAAPETKETKTRENCWSIDAASSPTIERERGATSPGFGWKSHRGESPVREAGTSGRRVICVWMPRFPFPKTPHHAYVGAQMDNGASYPHSITPLVAPHQRRKATSIVGVALRHPPSADDPFPPNRLIF